MAKVDAIRVSIETRWWFVGFCKASCVLAWLGYPLLGRPGAETLLSALSWIGARYGCKVRIIK